MGSVTMVLPCRDCEATVPATIRRALDLDYPAAQLRFVAVEGDSVDGTWGRLHEWCCDDPRMRLVRCDTGKPRYGSVIDGDRFAGLAQVFNAGLAAVDLAWSTHVLMMPSDIVYGPGLLRRLLAHQVDIVSPLVWLGDIFYDTYAFVRDGRHLRNFQRRETRAQVGVGLCEMESVGGVMLMTAAVLRAGCRYTAQAVDVGLCETARARGFRVWADAGTHVFHPQREVGMRVVIAESPAL